MAVSAFADDLALARARMDGALAELASHDKLWIVVSGVETDGNTQKPFRYDVNLRMVVVENRFVPFMEVLDTRNGALTTRFAADGQRFWKYDLLKKEYNSTDYATGAYVGKERERLFQNFSLRAKGNQTFLSRLLQDAFGNTNRAAWMPWRPNSKVAVTDDSIICSTSVPRNNTLIYQLQQTPGFGSALRGATYYEESVISGRTRTIQWQMTIYPDQLPKWASFYFVPPDGARAVSVDEGG